MQIIIEKILDFIFPRTKIQKKLDNISTDDFYQLAQKTRSENSIFSYEDRLVKEAIWHLKFRRNKRMAKIFAEIVYNYLLEKLSEMEIFSNFNKPIIIPIPLSKEKFRERGFNQCELIAREIIKIDSDSFCLETGVLTKTKETPPQSRTKNKKERLENIKGCFSIKNKEKIKNKNIILLDDVTTTGATLNEASKILKRNGAKKIFTITLANS